MIHKIKNISLLLLLTLSCTDTPAQGIHFETGDWASVQEKAKASNKLIFVDVYTTWCGPCKQMDIHVFKNKEVGDYFSTHFISYKLDAEKGEGIDFNTKYAIASYPSLLFVDYSGKLVIRHSGSLDVKQMLEFGDKAQNAEQEATTMVSAYNNGDRTPEFILKYLAFLKARDLPTEDIILGYFEKIDKQQWLSKDNLKLIDAYLHSPYNAVFEYLMEQKGQSTSESHWMSTIPGSVYRQYLKRLVNERRDQEIDELLAHASARLTWGRAYFGFRANILTAKRDQDWENYIKHISAYLNTYALDQPATLNNYAYAFYKNPAITDPNALNEALGWVNKALDANDGYDSEYLDTKAALLYKLGKKEEALAAANSAVKIIEQAGGSASETLKLIEKIKNN